MMQSPTNATIQGKRVWVEGATDAEVEYINYHVQMGLGLHIQYNPKLPQVERINTDGTPAREPK
jgi:hypothetical protein